MLQQTQVSRGLLFYDRWLAQFPNWKALSAASNADVIRAWAGLGYNRRALMLRDIARDVIKNSKIQEPKTREEWMKFKGVGPYTAAAVAAFAYRQRALPVDTNVRRVLGRLLFGIPYPQPTIDDKIRRAADRVLPKRGRFYDVPQALFDLATTTCAKVPDCAACPMRSACPAAPKFLSGRVRVPKRATNKSVETRHAGKPYPDRIYRGRILMFVRERGSVDVDAIGPAVDPAYDKKQDRAWVLEMIRRLDRDELIRLDRGCLRLP
jgi:A/G-specific adenine glycosylase